jgi:hypothetical protein
MRGIEEWNRHAVPAVRNSQGKIIKPGHDPYGGTGEWSFRLNRKAIEAYWRVGIQRMVDQHFEGIITLGMRGNGDIGLPDGESIDLMKDIIATQRRIIAEVTHKDVRTIPQVWTLYKEVQRYWDKGLRVPDDVIVNFTDDNWSNIRRLPSPTEKRSGGYGLYYHFDYVGVGRNYKWVDTANIANVWDQLHQTYAYGDSSLWVTNVGDLKGNELPTQFFLDYAWSPNRWSVNHLREWEQRYAAENFGTSHARAIADVLHTYGQLQARRKPELLNRKITVDPTKAITDPAAIVYNDQASPFSLTDYRELDRVTAEWQQLARAAARIRAALPARLHDAWFELVGYEVTATANLYALRDAEFTNILYARQGRALTNDLAGLTEARFAEDLKLADYFNHGIAGGKWNGFQTQPHIDYGDVARYGPDAPWQQPQINNDAIPDVIFPAVRRISLPAAAEMGVAIDGSDAWWPASSAPARLPTFSPYQTQPTQFIDVFNRGAAPFQYRIRPAASWVTVTPAGGPVHKQVRAWVHVDWSRAPLGTTNVPVRVTGANGRTVVVQALVDNPRTPRAQLRGFVEANGYVSMEAEHYSRNVARDGIAWTRIPDIGRTDSGMEPFPVTASSRTAGAGPRLEYTMTLFTAGRVGVNAYLSPRNDVFPGHGLRYAVSIDGEKPHVVDITAATGADATALNMQWARNTSDNVNVTTTVHVVARPGVHVLKVWMIDPTVVVQKLVVDTGGLRPSYLGPPESRRVR